MPTRLDIVKRAYYWAAPGEWKPDADHLIGFFEKAKTEEKPSQASARAALAAGGTGVKVGTQTKQWCGIFACSVLAELGVDCYWTLVGGGVRGKGVTGALPHAYPLRKSSNVLQPGDIAVIKRAQHHFIVTDINYAENQLYCVEGNTTGQLIRRAIRPIKYPASQSNESVDYFYRFIK